LVTAGWWSQIEPKVVYTENVRQALQFAQTGNVDAALVAHALISETGSSSPVDSELYAPLMQTVVVCVRGKNRLGGAQFIQRLVSDDGRALLKSFGFEPP
jgi:molybdate transport system substrate-binding protein